MTGGSTSSPSSPSPTRSGVSSTRPHDRGLTPSDPQDHQDARPLPDRRRRRKLIYLSIIDHLKTWKSIYNWSPALLSFKIHVGDRLPCPAYPGSRTPPADCPVPIVWCRTAAGAAWWV